MPVVNGWRLFAHPLFLGQVDRLMIAVKRGRKNDPVGYAEAANFKLLTALRKLVSSTIPADPMRPEYRQGDTLGPGRKHWFRAKFGGQRYRLFFRFDSRARIIVFTWVNDERTLRTYGSKTDAYAVFRSMLGKGEPPDDWNALLAAASSVENVSRFEKQIG